jgi:hypothetical protein
LKPKIDRSFTFIETTNTFLILEVSFIEPSLLALEHPLNSPEFLSKTYGLLFTLRKRLLTPPQLLLTPFKIDLGSLDLFSCLLELPFEILYMFAIGSFPFFPFPLLLYPQSSFSGRLPFSPFGLFALVTLISLPLKLLFVRQVRSHAAFA